MKDEKKFNPSLFEKKWQEEWKKNGVFSPNLNNSKNPYYSLMMFPYPSAEGLHVGNMYAFTGADVHARFMRMQGRDVFEPIGLDGFGIHSENYAMKVGQHPQEQAKKSEKNFYRQLESIGNSFDWKRTLETYDPKYYKWTQWLFIQLFKKGLAYRKKATVNWCPSDKTVLADEQVIDGKCERDGAVVEKRELEQWFFKITDYADRLLEGLEKIDWPEKVKTAQRQWIGKSEGALIKFQLVDISGQKDGEHFVEVFTTRPDTLFGATFLVISPELAKKWLDVGWKASDEVKKYIKTALENRKPLSKSENKEKSGVFAGINAINPVNNEKIPVWVADYVLADYGTGAIMAVPAHDGRDFEFVHEVIKDPKYIKEVISSSVGKKLTDTDVMLYEGKGIIVNSGEWDGLDSSKDMQKVLAWLEDKNRGERETSYHLRDWLISRQRYWGPPIPMIYCENCADKRKGERDDMPGWYSVADKDLPVLLPDVQDWRPEGEGKSPLDNHPEFYKTTCSECGEDAKRETDVSDTFLDSAWYYLRYTSVDYNKMLYDIDIVKKWYPVAIYIGGAEHSVLHLLYVRFIAMVLADLKMLPQGEPFPKFFAHGLIIKDGAKMSKSRGNVVIPDEYIAKYGADTLRMYLMFIGQFSEGGDFRDTGIEGMGRFVRRVWKLINNIEVSDKEDPDVERLLHKTIKAVTKDIERFSYNTAIARIMEFYNGVSDKKTLSKPTIITLLKLISPFAPHFTEELWREMSLGEGSIHKSAWPTYNEKYLIQEMVTVVVQVNGKVRENLILEADLAIQKDVVEEKARESEKIKYYLNAKKAESVVFVPGKIINFVTS